MKKRLYVIGLVLLLFTLAACGTSSNGGGTESEEGPSFEKVAEAVENAMKESLMDQHDIAEEDAFAGYFNEDLTKEDDEQFMTDMFVERMELDINQLAHGKAIGSLINVNADEVFILEAKNEDDVASLKEALEKELSAQTQTWEMYLPDQYEKVKENVIETKGKFVLYVTFSEPDKVVDAFNNQFK